MFSLSVVDTDKFLEMPVSARLLYYELGMRADDDGFIDNWKKILLFTGLKEDDLKILVTKQFIIPFETGVIVIKHWRMNNYLQNDRTKPTIHQDELQQLSLNNGNVYTLDTNRIHSIDKSSIDENRLDEVSIDNISSSEALPIPSKKALEKQYIQEFNKLWEYYPNKKGKEQAKSKYILARNDGVTYEVIANGLKNYINYIKAEKIESKYIKHGSTWFNQKCWNDDYKITSNNSSKKSDEQIEFLKGVHNGTIKVG